MMELNPVLIIAVIATVIIIFLVFLSLKPIEESQLNKLALKIREHKVKNHFPKNFKTSGKSSRFKKHMNPKGGFFETNIDRKSIAVEATKMLKYKKHEWIIIAYEKNQKIKLIWTNKGNEKSVYPLLRNNQQLQLVQKRDFDTVYIFHNHPPHSLFKGDKIRLLASQQDYKSAKYTAKFYKEQNVTIAEYVCANKGYTPYFISPKKDLFPFKSIYQELEEKANSKFQRIGLWFKIWRTNDVDYISLE